MCCRLTCKLATDLLSAASLSLPGARCTATELLFEIIYVPTSCRKAANKAYNASAKQYNAWCIVCVCIRSSPKPKYSHAHFALGVWIEFNHSHFPVHISPLLIARRSTRMLFGMQGTSVFGNCIPIYPKRTRTGMVRASAPSAVNIFSTYRRVCICCDLSEMLWSTLGTRHLHLNW